MTHCRSFSATKRTTRDEAAVLVRVAPVEESVGPRLGTGWWSGYRRRPVPHLAPSNQAAVHCNAGDRDDGGIPSLKWRILASFLRGRVGGFGMFMRQLAMSLRRSSVFPSFFVFAGSVVMLRLMVMMRGSVVVRSGQVMMLTGRVLRLLRHLHVLLIF
jgi:hypothetical protein